MKFKRKQTDKRFNILHAKYAMIFIFSFEYRTMQLIYKTGTIIIIKLCRFTAYYYLSLYITHYYYYYIHR